MLKYILQNNFVEKNICQPIVWLIFLLPTYLKQYIKVILERDRCAKMLGIKNQTIFVGQNVGVLYNVWSMISLRKFF